VSTAQPLLHLLYKNEKTGNEDAHIVKCEISSSGQKLVPNVFFQMVESFGNVKGTGLLRFKFKTLALTGMKHGST
jgi:hypothetical protein